MTFFDFFKVVGKSILFTIFLFLVPIFVISGSLPCRSGAQVTMVGLGWGCSVPKTSIWRQFRDLTDPREQGNRLHTAQGESENCDPDPDGPRESMA